MGNTVLAVLPRAANLLFVAAGLALAGCDLPTKTSAENYTLATVNQQALPGPFPDPRMPVGVFRVTAGKLVLHDDGTHSGSFTSVCAQSSTPLHTCEIDDPVQRFEGTYSREEGWLDFGDRRYPAEFTSGAVSVRIYIPAYMGYFPEYNLRFTR